MKKFKSKCGYVVYKATLTECVKITDGYGTCDNCNKNDLILYVIPVLNSAYCERCFKKWNEDSILNREDLEFENSYIKIFEKRAKEKGVELEIVT